QAQFAARAVERGYVAVVEGGVRDDAGTLRDRIVEDPTTLRVRAGRGGGREAVTEYRVRERRARSTVLELRLRTGRRGQIRAQLAALGHPIVGDRAFGATTDPVRRVCLHAAVLGFTDARGRAQRFTSAPPTSWGASIGPPQPPHARPVPGNPRRASNSSGPPNPPTLGASRETRDAPRIRRAPQTPRRSARPGKPVTRLEFSRDPTWPQTSRRSSIPSGSMPAVVTWVKTIHEVA